MYIITLQCKNYINHSFVLYLFIYVIDLDMLMLGLIGDIKLWPISSKKETIENCYLNYNSIMRLTNL